MNAPPGQNREFPFYKITVKRTIYQEHDYDIHDQHNILVTDMLTNPSEEMVTRILLHSVISPCDEGSLVHKNDVTSFAVLFSPRRVLNGLELT